MRNKKSMTYSNLIRQFKRKEYELKSYGAVKENGKKYPLYKIVINPRYKETLLITTGFHGDEFNGPISILKIIDEIARYAKEVRVRLVIYICVNPSGFDLHQPYNASGEGEIGGNNYFMKYQIKNGEWAGILRPGEKFISYKIVNSPAKEVHPLKRDVLRYRIPEAVLDIHQQKGNLDTGDIFAYIFDKRSIYKRIMKKLEKIAKIAKNDPTAADDGDRKIHYRIDDDGFIFLHDGTVTDMFYRLGSKFVVTAETDTRLSLKKVCKLNLIWIMELIKLISKKGK